ncbi:MAG: filamentous hemagglutinin N-terminal domain-containing protein [Scytonema sp. PMC 1069.18]|nr:filamentous hemagglutinin N-terminal domain-containing protein [Scytonema sp. PMC 1069.18]MEC4880474.1 filamentous hemagglutinin N-terminal domain-containing protein [Scytonema sp. PMC 1070.18]
MKRDRWLKRCWKSGLLGLLGWLSISVFACKTLAQQSNIVPDNTLGAESSQVLPNYQGQPIEVITGGATRGINLFHSFREFNVSEGRGAYFFSPNADIQNILTRVTGSNRSDILGTLGTFGESPANLFLINPNGIVFGENASLDVQGSLVATTANSVQFGDRGSFNASIPQLPSQLLTINPSAFLFNAIANQRIINRSRANTNVLGSATMGLQVPNGKSLLLLGGDIDVDSGGLFAFGGRVELGGLSTRGTVGIQENGNNLSFSFPDDVERADVFFRNDAFVNVSSAGGGNININARNVNFSESGLRAGISVGNGTTTSKAGNIVINAIETVSLTKDSYIFNTLQRRATGKAGDIHINTGYLNLDNGSTFVVSTYGNGDAGNLFINVSDAVSLTGRNTEIFNDVEPGAVGNGGEINIKAGSLILSERAQIEASVISGGRNQPAGRGNAGNVNIDVRGNFSLLGVRDNTSDSNNTAIFNTLGNGSVGAGGNINIKANSVLLTDGGQLGTSTFGRGNAGNILIQATDDIFLDKGYVSSLVIRGAVGNGGNISINSGTLTLNNGALLQTSVQSIFNNEPAGLGNAGTIKIDVRDAVTVSERGSRISSTVGNGGIGNGGDISIKAGSLFVDHQAEIIASSFGQGDAGSIFIEALDKISFNNGFAFSTIGREAVGNGGDISIKTGSLFVNGNGQLIASSFGKGDAGNIFIEGRDRVSFNGGSAESDINIGAVGDSGDINIKAGSLFASNDAFISASTYGRGNSGNITLNASDSMNLTNAQIFSTVEAGGVGKGGDIDVKASTLSLFDSAQFVTSVRKADENQLAGQGNAGNINVNVTGAVTFSGIKNGFSSGIFSDAETGTIGNGGSINITSGSLLLSDQAKLLASTHGQGDAGKISITASDSIFINDARIFSTVEAGGVGNAGDIDINAASLSLQNIAQIQTLVRGANDNLPAARGNAGNVNVNVTGTVAIANNQDKYVSGIGSEVGREAIGNAGDINITSGSLLLNNGSQLSTSTSGKGNAGSIFLSAKDSISLTGNARFYSMVRVNAVGKGGNIEIDANSLSLEDSSWLMSSTYGQGSAGSVIINVRDNVLFNGGRIYSTVETRSVGNGGNIFIKAGNLTLDNGSLQTLVRGAYEDFPAGRGNAGEINIDVRDTINISGVDGGVYSLVEEETVGNGGNINIKTGSLLVSNGAELLASILGKGSAGNISIDARENVQFDGANAYSTIGYLGDGNGGDINIKARLLFFTNGTEIGVSTFGIGSAGNLILNARENILFDNTRAYSAVVENAIGNGGEIRINTANLSVINDAFFNTATDGQGSSGNVIIDARGRVLFDKGSVFSSVIENAVGNGGEIRINAELVSLMNKSGLQASTFGRGNAGNIIINARDRISFNEGSLALSQIRQGGVGKGGDIRITTNSLSLTNGSLFTASTFGEGEAGNLQIRANDSINIIGSSISENLTSGLYSTTNENSVGKGGNITVDTKNFRLSEGGLLSTRTRTDSQGGNITVNTDNLEVINGGQLLTTTFSSGRAGAISINATKRVVIDGSDATFNDRIARFPDILDDRDATANSGLFVSSTGSGTTGDIFVTTPKITLDHGGRINAESTSGNGGNINLTVSDLLLMRRSGKISTNAGTAQQGGDGGNIDINSRFIVAIPNENSDITANAFTGAGGKVQITSLGVFGIEPRQTANDITSDITASSEQGVQGVTAINAPDNSAIQNSLNQLSDNPIDANALIANSCFARRDSPQGGTFFIIGKGGLPERPGEGGVSTFATGKMQGVPRENQSSTSRPRWKIGDPIVEPTGVYTLANGKRVLGRECD